jgi:hypothetical protein
MHRSRYSITKVSLWFCSAKSEYMVQRKLKVLFARYQLVPIHRLYLFHWYIPPSAKETQFGTLELCAEEFQHLGHFTNGNLPLCIQFWSILPWLGIGKRARAASTSSDEI